MKFSPQFDSFVKTFLPIDSGVKVLFVGGGFNLLAMYTNASYKLVRCIADVLKWRTFSLLHQALALLAVDSNSLFSTSLVRLPITVIKT